ncbi:protein mesh-like [Mytilus edulis]|uniref:protein mesh-like n=1 Tax=Mytilus edulis TaxID=6550 RepID=UPI0039EFFBE5
MKTFFLFCLLFSFTEKIYGVSLSDFYPFGRGNGDKRAPTNDDGSTQPIPISSLFPIFNHQHNSLIVNTNGVISFLGTMNTFTPSAFPLSSERRIIAPYWADIDTNNGGDVWFRESTNLTLLGKASEEIHDIFPEHFNFHAAWMFIATWDNVAFYGSDSIGRQKRCTFQCVLVTNGRHSFTIFLYDKIEWTTGTASGSNSSSGLDGTPAQVGFDAGDGLNFYAIEASRTTNIINVTQMSNIDVPGKFIFRVDSTSIKKGGCNVEGTLTITPREATMIGGTKLIISGPCLNLTEAISLLMSDGKDVPCQKYNQFSVSCISPPVYRTGKEIVVLRLIQANSNQTLQFAGVLKIVNPALVRHVLTRGQLSWRHGTPKKHSQIKLNHHSLISILSPADMTRELYNFQLNFTEEAGIVKLSTNDINSPYYWSDMFTVNVGLEHSQAVCDKMLNEDVNFPPIDTDDVQPCPCTLNVASLDTTRFSVDHFCHKQEGSAYKCTNQPFAQICFRQNVPSSRGYDHQCCYDEVGVLMNPNGYYGSGYVNRYHYHGDGAENIPYFSNFMYDTIPYKHCCIYTSEDSEEVDSNFGSCASFYSRRPPNSCLNYVPPRPARVSGDPHFVTFDGHAYTFNPAGEFGALSNGNLSLQLRMEQIGSSQASSVTSFVARPYPGADTIEVQTNQIRGIDVLVNGTVLDLDSSISKVNSVEGTTIEKTSDDPPTVVTTFYTEGLSIRSSSQQNVLNLVILTSPDRQTGNLTGLFGDNDGIKDNDLVSKQNDVIEGNASASDIHSKFGLSWRIEESESLFTYEGGKTFSSYQNENFNPLFVIPEDVPTYVSDLCGSKTECIYDTLVTNNTDFGQMSADSTAQFDHVTNITAPTVTCGFPSNTSNAVWIANGLTEGSIALLNCKKGYYPLDVNRKCLSFGNWSSVNISCIPFPVCGAPPSVANATWLPDVDYNGKRATLRCKHGFYGKEIEILCTNNGTWTEFEDHDPCYPECKNPNDVQNGNWNVSGWQNGSTAILTCNENYLSRSAVEIKCHFNGQWDKTNATCIVVTTTQTVGQTVETSSDVHSSAMRELSTIMLSTHISAQQTLSITTPATTSPVTTIQRSSEQNMFISKAISTPLPQTQTLSSRQTTLRSSPQDISLSQSISSPQQSPLKTTQIPAAPTSTIVDPLQIHQPSTTLPSETASIKTTEPTAKQTTESTAKQTTESTAKQTTESTAKQTTESTKHQTTESTTESTKHQTTESTTESTKHQTTESTTQTSQKESSKSSLSAVITNSVPSRINVKITSAPQSSTTTIPKTKPVSEKFTQSNFHIKSTRVTKSKTEPTSVTKTLSLAGKSTSATKSLNSVESNKADKAADFTIAASATVLVVGLIIFITVVVVSIVRLSKTKNGDTKRYQRRKTHEEDRSSVSSDPSSWYNFHIKRPLFKTKWTNPRQNDMHLRW